MAACELKRGAKFFALVSAIVGAGVVPVSEWTDPPAARGPGEPAAAIHESIRDSPHDFSSGDPDDSATDGCGACHIVSQEFVSVLTLTDPAASAEGSYKLSGDLQVVGLHSGPTDISTFCLSCHDGTVGKDAGIQQMASNSLEPDLAISTSATHPVSIRYDRSRLKLKATSAAVVFGDGKLGTVADLLVDGCVECTSCHDVHNVRTPGDDTLLNIENTGSRLCLSCHDLAR